MAIPDDSKRTAWRSRAATDAAAKSLAAVPGIITLDFSRIVVANLTAAKRMLEIPEVPPTLELTIVAAENIPAWVPVTAQGRRADSGNPSASFGRVIGLAGDGIQRGRAGRVIRVGEITNPDWAWNTGEQIFLSGTGIANSAPTSGFVQRIGTASGQTKMVVDLGEPILL